MFKYKARRLTPPELSPHWAVFPQTKFTYSGTMKTIEEIHARFPSGEYEVVIEGEAQ